VSNLDDKSPVTGIVKDGKIYLCEPGCSDCSTGVCISCKEGYVLDAIVNACKKCGPGCKVCDSADSNKCSVCYEGLYQENPYQYICKACDPNCATCSFASASCDSCVP
jgi:hypothetical protein